MKQKLSQRAKAHRQRLRRDPFGRLALAVSDYLDTIGWSAVVVGAPAIAEDVPASSHQQWKLRRAAKAVGLNRYQLILRFTGGRRV